jgi:hypothetical protein
MRIRVDAQSPHPHRSSVVPSARTSLQFAADCECEIVIVAAVNSRARRPQQSSVTPNVRSKANGTQYREL